MEAVYLLERIAQGDRVAFSTFYALFAEQVYNTAFHYTQQKQDAEEITQDVFVRIFEKAATFRQQSAVRTWVYASRST